MKKKGLSKKQILVFVVTPLLGLILSVMFAYLGRGYFEHWGSVLITNLYLANMVS